MAVISRNANDLAAARARLPVVAQRFCELTAAIRRPDRPSVGEWTVADVAAHVSHVSAGEAFVAATAGNTVGSALEVGDDLVTGVARFNSGNLGSDPERDPGALAERVEASVAELLTVMAPLRGDEPVAWVGASCFRQRRSRATSSASCSCTVTTSRAPRRSRGRWSRWSPRSASGSSWT